MSDAKPVPPPESDKSAKPGTQVKLETKKMGHQEAAGQNLAQDAEPGGKLNGNGEKKGTTATRVDLPGEETLLQGFTELLGKGGEKADAKAKADIAEKTEGFDGRINIATGKLDQMKLVNFADQIDKAPIRDIPYMLRGLKAEKALFLISTGRDEQVQEGEKELAKLVKDYPSLQRDDKFRDGILNSYEQMARNRRNLRLPDWQSNLQVSDVFNETQDKPKDAGDKKSAIEKLHPELKKSLDRAEVPYQDDMRNRMDLFIAGLKQDATLAQKSSNGENVDSLLTERASRLEKEKAVVQKSEQSTQVWRDVAINSAFAKIASGDPQMFAEGKSDLVKQFVANPNLALDKGFKENCINAFKAHDRAVGTAGDGVSREDESQREAKQGKPGGDTPSDKSTKDKALDLSKAYSGAEIKEDKELDSHLARTLTSIGVAAVLVGAGLYAASRLAQKARDARESAKHGDETGEKIGVNSEEARSVKADAPASPKPSDTQRDAAPRPSSGDVNIDGVNEIFSTAQDVAKGNVDKSKLQEVLTKNVDKLDKVDPRVIYDGLTRVLMGDKPSETLEVLHQSGVLKKVLPEVAALDGLEQDVRSHPENNTWKHVKLVVDGAAKAEGLTTPQRKALMWSALLHDIGMPATQQITPQEGGLPPRVTFLKHDKVGAEMTDKILDRLKVPQEERPLLHDVVGEHMNMHLGLKDSKVRTLMEKYGPDYKVFVALQKADALGRDVHTPQQYEQLGLKEEGLPKPVNAEGKPLSAEEYWKGGVRTDALNEQEHRIEEQIKTENINKEFKRLLTEKYGVETGKQLGDVMKAAKEPLRGFNTVEEATKWLEDEGHRKSIGVKSIAPTFNDLTDALNKEVETYKREGTASFEEHLSKTLGDPQLAKLEAERLQNERITSMEDAIKLVQDVTGVKDFKPTKENFELVGKLLKEHASWYSRVVEPGQEKVWNKAAQTAEQMAAKSPSAPASQEQQQATMKMVERLREQAKGSSNENLKECLETVANSLEENRARLTNSASFELLEKSWKKFADGDGHFFFGSEERGKVWDEALSTATKIRQEEYRKGLEERVKTAFTNLAERARQDPKQVAKEALTHFGDAKDEDTVRYRQSVERTRSKDGPTGSYWDVAGADLIGNSQKAGLLQNADWQFDRVENGKVYLKANIPGGKQGMVPLADLPPGAKLQLVDAKGSGDWHIAVDGGPQNYHPTQEAWLIITPERELEKVEVAPGKQATLPRGEITGKPAIITFFPGAMEPPSELNDIKDGARERVPADLKLPAYVEGQERRVDIEVGKDAEGKVRIVKVNGETLEKPIDPAEFKIFSAKVSPPLEERAKAALDKLADRAKQKPKDVVKEALLNFADAKDEDTVKYRQAVERTRSKDGPTGSYWDVDGGDLIGTREKPGLLQNADWQFDRVENGKVYLKANIPGGKQGMVPLADLPQGAKLHLIDAKGSGDWHIAIDGDSKDYHPTQEAWMILTPERRLVEVEVAPGKKANLPRGELTGKPAIITFFPGAMEPPSELNDTKDGSREKFPSGLKLPERVEGQERGVDIELGKDAEGKVRIVKVNGETLEKPIDPSEFKIFSAKVVPPKPGSKENAGPAEFKATKGDLDAVVEKLKDKDHKLTPDARRQLVEEKKKIERYLKDQAPKEDPKAQLPALLDKIPNQTDRDKFMELLNKFPEEFQDRYIKNLKMSVTVPDEVGRTTQVRGLLFEMQRISTTIEQGLEKVDLSKPVTQKVEYNGYDRGTTNFSEAPQHKLKSEIKINVPIMRDDKPFVYEVKSYPRLSYGSEVEQRNQILKYQEAIRPDGKKENGIIDGATIEVKGRIDPKFLAWLNPPRVGDKSPAPDVEVLYSFELPSGRDFRFVLKRSESNNGLKFQNDDKGYTAEDKLVIRGIQKAILDRSIDSIISGTKVNNPPDELKPYLESPDKLRDLAKDPEGLRLFNEYEKLRRETIYADLTAKAQADRVNSTNPRTAYGPDCTRESIERTVREYQDYLKQNPEMAKIKQSYILDSEDKIQKVIEQSFQRAQKIGESEKERQKSPQEAERQKERERLGYKGNAEGVALDIDHIIMDVIQDVNKTGDKRGRNYDDPGQFLKAENLKYLFDKKSLADKLEQEGRLTKTPEGKITSVTVTRQEARALGLADEKTEAKFRGLDPDQTVKIDTKKGLDLTPPDRRNIIIELYDPRTGTTEQRTDQPERQVGENRTAVLKENIIRAKAAILQNELRFQELSGKPADSLVDAEKTELAKLAARHRAYKQNEGSIGSLDSIRKDLRLYELSSRPEKSLTPEEKAEKTELAKAHEGQGTLDKSIEHIAKSKDGVIAPLGKQMGGKSGEEKESLRKQIDDAKTKFDGQIEGTRKALLEMCEQILGGEKVTEKLFKTMKVSEQNIMKFAYAVTADGELRLSEEILRGDISGRAAHSELAEGKNIYGAGELVFERNSEGKWVLTEINNGSGHYRPSGESLVYVKNILEKAGIDTSQVILNDALMRGTPLIDATLFDDGKQTVKPSGTDGAEKEGERVKPEEEGSRFNEKQRKALDEAKRILDREAPGLSIEGQNDLALKAMLEEAMKQIGDVEIEQHLAELLKDFKGPEIRAYFAGDTGGSTGTKGPESTGSTGLVFGDEGESTKGQQLRQKLIDATPFDQVKALELRRSGKILETLKADGMDEKLAKELEDKLTSEDVNERTKALEEIDKYYDGLIAKSEAEAARTPAQEGEKEKPGERSRLGRGWDHFAKKFGENKGKIGMLIVVVGPLLPLVLNKKGESEGEFGGATFSR